jgi:hypothetical protein
MMTEPQSGGVDRLVDYTNSFARGLLVGLSSLPTLIRHFFARAFAVGGLDLVHILFYDLILKPALMNPKLFALLPETAVMPPEANKSIVELTRIFWLAMKPDQLGGPRYQSYGSLTDVPKFRDIPVAEFFRHLVAFDDEIEGISLQRLQEVTGVRYHLLLMSVADVLFLTEIINSSLPSLSREEGADTLRNLADFQIPIESNEIVDFWLQQFKSPIVDPGVKFPNDQVEADRIYLPILSNIPETTPKPGVVVAHFMNYLQGLKLDVDAPGDLAGFLRHQLDRASQSHSTEWLSRTQSIDEQIQQLGCSESQLLADVTAALDGGLRQSKASLIASFAHQKCHDELCRAAKFFSRLNSQLTPIIHQALLAAFINDNKQSINQITKSKNQLVTDQATWAARFVGMAADFLKFAGGKGVTETVDSPALSRQLHSRLCRDFPYEGFREQNPNARRHDEILAQNYGRLFEKVMREHIAVDGLDEVAVNLANGMRIGSPLDRLGQIMGCLKTAKEIWRFEAGEKPGHDDMRKLVLTTLFKRQIPEIISMSRYLEVLLFIGCQHPVVLLSPKEQRGMAVFFEAIKFIRDQCGLRV